MSDKTAQGVEQIMIPEQMREAFEHWFSSNGCDPLAICRNDDGSYVLTPAEISWASWQAALSQPAPQGVTETLEKIREALELEMVAAYDCTRVWEAWHIGTMTEDDFVPVTERLDDVVDSVMAPITALITERDTLRARVAELERDAELIDLISQRDHREEIIDQLCDAVLGPDRAEWSSAYYFEDAVSEVQERIAELETRKECRESNKPVQQGEQEPAPNVLATLRAEVSRLPTTYIKGTKCSWSVNLAEVLALIDKMGGKV